MVSWVSAPTSPLAPFACGYVYDVQLDSISSFIKVLAACECDESPRILLRVNRLLTRACLTGSRICKAAVSRGWSVTSISRSGEPTWSSVSSSTVAPPWAEAVKWTKADVLEPSTYNNDLKGADAVIHSMGILLEADYKGVLQGKEPVVKGLQRAFSATKLGSENPLEKDVGDGVRPQEKDGQTTYELMNRDSAILLAKEANASGAKTFAYISAAAGAPILPARYITTKRAAESTIKASFPNMRNIFIRPGMLYDSSRGITMPLAAMTGAGWLVNSLVGGNLTWLMGAGGTKPLKADIVAQAIVESIDQDNTSGIIEVPRIEELANSAWRKSML